MRYNDHTHSDPHWMLADERGSVVAYYDDTGARQGDINTYDEYGEQGANNHGLFRYAGRPWLRGADVYDNRNRAYHPGLGRFLQRDPIGQAGGLNIYNYTGSDPVNYTDPWGLSAVPPCPPGMECIPSQPGIPQPRHPCRGVCFGRAYFQWMKQDMMDRAAELAIKSMHLIHEHIIANSRHALACVAVGDLLNTHGLRTPSLRIANMGLAMAGDAIFGAETALNQLSFNARVPASTASAEISAFVAQGQDPSRFSVIFAGGFGPNLPSNMRDNPARFLRGGVALTATMGVTNVRLGEFGGSDFFQVSAGKFVGAALVGFGSADDGISWTLMAGLSTGGGITAIGGANVVEYGCAF